MTENKLILVTGATGYVGGRLVPRLLDAGYGVRVLVRDPVRARGKSWSDKVQIVQGNVGHPESLAVAMEGVDLAYYFVHRLTKSQDFIESDVADARNFGSAARAAGVRRIIYLGQLGEKEGEAASPYLRARHQAGNALRESGLPVTEFRTSAIIGSGSVTFEMIRYLSERWPWLVCPLWAYTLNQPIAIRDVLAYLIAALDTPESADKIIDIGGPDTLTFAEMLLGYSVERGLARWMIPVRLMTPALSAIWTRMISPLSIDVARPLIELMRSNSIADTETAEKLFPAIRPIPYHRAVKLAIERFESHTVETAWSDALVTSMGDNGTPVVLGETEGFFIERRERVVNASAEACYLAFTSLGGETGWLYLDWMWDVRGWMDEVIGGVGMRRGRRHPQEITIGDAVDFWRVEALEPNRLMRLRAEMKVPGKAWLECRVKPLENGKSLLNISALYEPKGVSGQLYWFAMAIPHLFIFSGMARKIDERAEQMMKAGVRIQKDERIAS